MLQVNDCSSLFLPVFCSKSVSIITVYPEEWKAGWVYKQWQFRKNKKVQLGNHPLFLISAFVNFFQTLRPTESHFHDHTQEAINYYRNSSGRDEEYNNRQESKPEGRQAQKMTTPPSFWSVAKTGPAPALNGQPISTRAKTAAGRQRCFFPPFFFFVQTHQIPIDHLTGNVLHV